MPGIAQVVAIGVSHSDERLDSVDVLLLHLCDAGAGRQQGKPSQGLHIGISLQLQTGRQEHTSVSVEPFSCAQTLRGTKVVWSSQDLHTCMLKMQAILMAQRMPSRHSEATSGSSQSCSPTLYAASKGVHANYNTCTTVGKLPLHPPPSGPGI